MANGERAFTQWSPDTCGCIIQYYNDDTSHHATMQACPKHAANAGTPQHLADVLGHNRNKNFVMNHLITKLGVVASENSPVSFAANYDPTAAVDADPVVVVGLTQEQKDTITSSAEFAASLAVGGLASTKMAVNGGAPVEVSGAAGDLATADGTVSVLLV